MNNLYLGVAGVIILGVVYGIWHHHVWQQGYNKRVSEEGRTVVAAQPTIKEGESQYADLIKKIYEAPVASCSVGPATSLVLDSLH